MFPAPLHIGMLQVSVVTDKTLPSYSVGIALLRFINQSCQLPAWC